MRSRILCASGILHETMKTALVFGATGQIGRPLVDRLRDGGWRVIAVSRQARSDELGVHWRQADLPEAHGLPQRVDATISCGPLDKFSHWYAQSDLRCARLIAFGSTSAATKLASADESERDVAQRLSLAESRIREAAHRRGAAVTLLRPSLVYGGGQDHTLTQIARLARRYGYFVLPRRAHGLRQPVHVHDLASAAYAALQSMRACGNTYDLPGGESLPYREMVQRVLACLSPSPRLVEVPMPIFRLTLRAAQARGIAKELTLSAVERMLRDLVFDSAPAQRDFGYAPRRFHPTAVMLDQV